MLLALYEFDVELRKIFFSYCKRAEIQFRNNLANAVSLKTNNPIFYIEEEYYTPTQGENDKRKRERNKKRFPDFLENIKNAEKISRKM
ncbi:Abi family protein [Sporosarcina sp. PTS2304]|uniref:Abi family protein n=1 Tax=Sporosarcina sp. PTS2304 TaxID=2283194 RepID=UPI00352F789B